ncbi:MAG: hypothetical protein K2M73_06225 [Lachnospiraceae bacterium]|nr:hypothetical protein [Lachnospiraceae bacterium]
MKKTSKVILAVVIVILVAATAVSTTFSIISFAEVKNMKKASEEESKNNEQEDDFENVLIGGQYQIISTKNISDAYISGDSSALNDEDKKTLEVASAILDEIITDNMSVYEKEEAIYKWICENVSHEENGTVAVPEARGIVDRPYGVLQNKQAVCVGFATSFRLLTNMIGLDCIIMHDTGLGHSWNIVKLDDDCWYIVDCYMDADNYSPLYSSFNMNDEYAGNSHDWDASLYPVANGTKYNYIESHKVKLDNPLELMKEISNLYKNEIYSGYFEIENTVENEAIVSYVVYGMESRMNDDNGYANFATLHNDGAIIVAFSYFIYDFDDTDTPGFDDPNIDYTAIDEKLDELFGTIDDDYYFTPGGLIG